MSYYARKKDKRAWLSSPPILLIYRIAAIILTLSISRWLLYIFNMQFFHELTLSEALQLYFYGMRFDLAVIAFINLPNICYYCFPSKHITAKPLQWFFDLIYVITNGFAILLNFVDIIYFHYIGKHITRNFLSFLRNSDELAGGFLKQIFFDYWYLFVIAILFIMLICVVTQRTRIRPIKEENAKSWLTGQYIAFPLAAALSLIACRGGIQEKSINLETALTYTDTQNAPILLSTPFTLIWNEDDGLIEEWNKFEDNPYSPIHNSLIHNRFINDSISSHDSIPDNLVLIILKGIGQEKISYYHPECRYSLTPFLDSLLSQSLTFDGRANGWRSIEALPSILASIPTLMEDDFVSSAYAENDFDGFALHLQKRGYNTIFMHGGDNGTMGFDRFAQRSGFKNYYGRVEYDDDEDYDGQWGIYDGPFLQYAARALNRQHGPFASAIYTLSSRHPFKVPNDFELPDESYYWTGYEKTVYYSDCAFRDFFSTASKMDWFSHTLFVITADFSNSEHFAKEYNNMWGMYAIPIAFYYPNHIKPKRCDEIAQQIDLGPSILSALKVDSDTVLSFGRNLFDTLSKPAFVSYFNHTYQYSDGIYLVQSSGDSPFGIYRPSVDPNLSKNLISLIQCPDVFDQLYQFVQDYNNRMISNQLTIKNDTINGETENQVYHQPDIGETAQEIPARRD